MSKVRDLYPVEEVARLSAKPVGRPHRPAPLPRAWKPAGMPSPAAGPWSRTFCDGVEYFFARFSHVFASDPVAFNAALLDIKYAREQNGHRHD